MQDGMAPATITPPDASLRRLLDAMAYPGLAAFTLDGTCAMGVFLVSFPPLLKVSAPWTPLSCVGLLDVSVKHTVRQCVHNDAVHNLATIVWSTYLTLRTFPANSPPSNPSQPLPIPNPLQTPPSSARPSPGWKTAKSASTILMNAGPFARLAQGGARRFIST
jgi:hypothetical protein